MLFSKWPKDFKKYIVQFGAINPFKRSDLLLGFDMGVLQKVHSGGHSLSINRCSVSLPILVVHVMGVEQGCLHFSSM